MEAIIRKARLEDKKQIQKVAQVSWHNTYEGIIPREVQDNFLRTAYNDERLERRIENSLLLVAEVENQVIGYANFSPVNEQGEAELGAIYLYPDYQGTGIGTMLLNKGIEQLADVKKVFINVESENEIGKTFYEAKGFQTFSKFDDNFDGHILKTIRMVLTV